MIKLASLVLFAVAAHCYHIEDAASENEKEKIVGGEVIRIEEAPYLAQILQGGRQVCGGTIISERWILTAAHCFPNTYKLTVITGSSWRSEGMRRKIKSIHIHKDFNDVILDNDIALIELRDEITFNNKQQPIAITATIPETNSQVKISGFGKVGEYESVSPRLQSAIVRVMSRKECDERYSKEEDKITDNMFCAGTGETDSCTGDSGGPAVIDGKLGGVISSGKMCGSPLYPGVYTQVYKYRQWIASKTHLDL